MTDIQVDSSCLPPVQEVCRDFAVLEDGALAYCLQEQEIELHYASNIQKNQLVQKDLRIAKRLQDQEMEAQKLQASNHQKEIKEKESENTQDLQAGLERRTKEDNQKSKVQERAKRFLKVEKEEHEKQGSRASRGTGEEPSWTGLQVNPFSQPCDSPQRSSQADHGALDPLCGGMAKLELQNQQQVQEDEQLARKLQAEEEQEESLLRARRNREQDDSYRAAQVAQDEEIARYLQDKELAAQWGSPSKDPASKLKEQPSRLWEGRGSTSQQMEAWQSNRTPPLHRTETQGSSEVTVRRNSTDKKPQLCWNIAEALDPTFQASKMGRPPDGMDLSSQASAPGQLGQVDSPFAPAFVSPTKRQPEKAGCSKSSEKKESCRQQ